MDAIDSNLGQLRGLIESCLNPMCARTWPNVQAIGTQLNTAVFSTQMFNEFDNQEILGNAPLPPIAAHGRHDPAISVFSVPLFDTLARHPI